MGINNVSTIWARNTQFISATKKQASEEMKTYGDP